jgi:hypothetical protein
VPSDCAPAVSGARRAASPRIAFLERRAGGRCRPDAAALFLGAADPDPLALGMERAVHSREDARHALAPGNGRAGIVEDRGDEPVRIARVAVERVVDEPLRVQPQRVQEEEPQDGDEAGRGRARDARLGQEPVRERGERGPTRKKAASRTAETRTYAALRRRR